MTPRQQAKSAGIVYTPTDVADYIARATIIPFILDAIASRCPEVFAPARDRLLAQAPDRYLPPVLRLTGALPTESRRERLARQERCARLRARLQQGNVAVNDVVSWNLDGQALVIDIMRASRPLAVAIAELLPTLTVLDPTCGDGAFLLAALRVLSILASGGRKPLEGQQTADDARPLRGLTPPARLCGIDLRPEAVEACRANVPGASIACGNAVDSRAWERAFPEVLASGGFDVILGNPPYVAADRAGYSPADAETAACPDVYAWVIERSAALLRPGGRCGMVVPLSLGFSSAFAPCRRLLLDAYASNWFASFGRIPAALFPFDVRIRNVIHLGHKAAEGSERRTHVTRLHRWYEEERPHLFASLDYTPVDAGCWNDRLPKLGGARLTAALETRLRTMTARLGDEFAGRPTPFRLYFKKTAYNWLAFARTLPPCMDDSGQRAEHTQFDVLYFPTAWQRDAAQVLLNGKWLLAWWLAVGDDFHVTRWSLAGFPADFTAISLLDRRQLQTLARRLEAAMRRAVTFKRNAGKLVGAFNLARCRAVTDAGDRLWGRLLGLEDAWDDVELLCSQVVRTDFTAYPGRKHARAGTSEHAD